VSKIQEKSGSIINNVGKSVNLFTISSICLVTQFIKNQGKDWILFFTILVTSEKSTFQLDGSIVTETGVQLVQIEKSGQFQVLE